MNIQNLINIALNSERYSPEYKQAWRQLFQHATQIAKSVPNRDLDPVTVVDNWLADHQLYLNHCDPADDLVAGDMSCMQAMRKQQHAFLNDIREQYITALRSADNRDYGIKRRQEFLNIAKRLRKLYDEENATNITSVPFEIYEELGNSAEFEEPITDTQAYVNRLEYRESINQEPECDPDDSHYVADTTRLNRKKPRGNIGLLNGLYQQSDPEPNYQTAERRACMLRQLRSSDNPQDIEMLFALTMPTRGNQTDEQWSICVTKRRKLRKTLIQKASES
jgi:hypothetical protein